jgi:hypothetical protein
MVFGVFIHRSDSIYDDTPAERYQFPRQYLERARACIGDWIVYYEAPKIAGTKGYYAVAKVERIIADLSTPHMYLALIEPGSYLDFATPVYTSPFWRSALSHHDDDERHKLVAEAFRHAYQASIGGNGLSVRYGAT